MTKHAKLASQARLPELANPPAIPTRLDAAMPTLKKRSGNFLAKRSVRVELWTSPSTTTMSEYLSPTAARATPNASRVDFPVFICVSKIGHSLRCYPPIHPLATHFGMTQFLFLSQPQRHEQVALTCQFGASYFVARGSKFNGPGQSVRWPFWLPQPSRVCHDDWDPWIVCS